MKLKILFFIVTIFSILSSVWLFILNDRAAIQYQEIYDSFGVTTPYITDMLFSTSQYWWIISGIIVLINYALLFLTNGKWQYISVITSLSFLLVLVGIVYTPIFMMGSVV